ncbi:MAG: molybdopterin-dependent oxidoreductase [Actinomycetota bacterium]|nr:molybdopterin-dependent oxidoreductase [Actinomycetota bacterium]
MIETKKTFCRVCHAACPMEIDVEDGSKIVNVRADRSDPLFKGFSCIKGRQLADQFHSPSRLRFPLRKTPSGVFDPISSADALDEIAQKLEKIISKYGPRSVATYIGTGAYQNSVGVAVASSWHTGFGSPSFYTSLTIDQPAHRSSLLRLGSWEAGWQNFSDANVLLAVGYNPLVSSYGPASGLQGTDPFVKLREAKERGLKLIVIDPRRSELAKQADLWLQVKPGEDPTLLSAIVNVILSNNLYDREFCDEFVEPDQLDLLKEGVGPFTAEYAATRCEVSPEDIEIAARIFAEGPKGTAGSGTGPNMAPHGTLMESLTLTLNVLCGRVLKEGETLESPYMLSPGDTRRAQVKAPSNPTPGAPHRVRGLYGLADEMLTNALNDEILLEGDGQVRALIVSGGNPVQAWPDQKKTLDALQSLELLVVIDHRMTATAELSDYIFAPRLQLEREDVPNVMDRRFPAVYTNYTDRVIDSGDDVLNEWEVFVGLAKRTGTKIVLPGGELPIETSLTDGDVIDYVYGNSRLPINEWRKNRGVIHDNPIIVLPADPTNDAKFAVCPQDVYSELQEVRNEKSGSDLLGSFSDSEFPFLLVGRRLKHALNSLGSELPGLARVATTNYAYVHPDDLKNLGAEPGDLLRITSPRSSVVGVAEIDKDIKQGVVAMSHSWGGRSLTDEKVRDIGTPTNRLVTSDSGYDRITGLPIMSAIPIDVHRITEDELLDFN